jgi:hypothetical protein
MCSWVMKASWAPKIRGRAWSWDAVRQSRGSTLLAALFKVSRIVHPSGGLGPQHGDTVRNCCRSLGFKYLSKFIWVLLKVKVMYKVRHGKMSG